MDGVSIGMLVDKLRDEENPLLPFISKEILDAPEFKDRMFIKLKKNRNLLQNVFKSSSKTVNLSKKDLEKDPNMANVQTYLSNVKSEGYSDNVEFFDLLTDISSVSSTTSIFQVMNVELLEKLKDNMLDKNSQIMKSVETLELKEEISKVYPLIYKRLKNISNLPFMDGKLPNFVKEFVSDLIDFVLNFYKSVPNRNKAFTKRTDGEN